MEYRLNKVDVRKHRGENAATDYKFLHLCIYALCEGLALNQEKASKAKTRVGGQR